jgi:hypothetical protein
MMASSQAFCRLGLPTGTWLSQYSWPAAAVASGDGPAGDAGAVVSSVDEGGHAAETARTRRKTADRRPPSPPARPAPEAPVPVRKPPLATVTVTSAFPASRGGDAAAALVFEYIAATQAENGRPVPSGIAELPAVLRRECSSLQDVYRSPGVFLIADLAGQPVGCAGLSALPGGRTAEVRRLYVRPARHNQADPRCPARPHSRHQLLPPPRLHRNRALRDRVARPDDLHGAGRHEVRHPQWPLKSQP